MTIILPTLAVSFAAFCVWLAVRIINRRERWAKWTLAALVGIPVLYVASFGPACWIYLRNSNDQRHETLAAIYRPMFRLWKDGGTAGRAVGAYAVWGLPPYRLLLSETENGFEIQCRFAPFH